MGVCFYMCMSVSTLLVLDQRSAQGDPELISWIGIAVFNVPFCLAVWYAPVLTGA